MIKSAVMLLTLVSGSVLAQCPQGMPNTPGCIPPSAWPQNQPQQAQPSVPTGHWEKRWGAYATDAVAGALGVSKGIPSKTKAQKIAMSACRTDGGKQCKITLTFANQCGAMVSGKDQVNLASGATIENAIDVAMADCQRESTNCRVFHTQCSDAEWISK